MSLWPVRMSGLEELVSYSYRRKFHFGTEVSVKVGIFPKIYHSTPSRALVMTMLNENKRRRRTKSRIAAPTFPEVDRGARWPAHGQHTCRWRGVRRRRGSPLMMPTMRTTKQNWYLSISFTIQFHFTVVCERVEWDLKYAFLWKGFKTSMTSLM